ncbi:MAG: adenylate/guanylate cyclase domain-containing protein [Chthoniobacterales bacterium]
MQPILQNSEEAQLVNPTEMEKAVELKIAHVLFLDIVGYSKLLIDEQRNLLELLNETVRQTDSFRAAEQTGRLVKLPTGDGMALVFYDSPEAPAECALEISRALKHIPTLPLRMGVHSGPVSGVVDAERRANVAGAGINIAQRVMDCGDAGHILISKRVADDLEHFARWRPYLHDLGDCEVKHAARVHIFNLYTDDAGNSAPPQKLRQKRAPRRASDLYLDRLSDACRDRINGVARSFGVRIKAYEEAVRLDPISPWHGHGWRGRARTRSTPKPAKTSLVIATLPGRQRTAHAPFSQTLPRPYSHMGLSITTATSTTMPPSGLRESRPAFA